MQGCLISLPTSQNSMQALSLLLHYISASTQQHNRNA